MFRHLVFTICVALGLAGTPLHAQQFLGKTLPEWTTQLKTSPDAKQRRSAAFALGKMGSRAAPALPALKSAFAKEKDARVRDAVLFSMGEISRDNDGVAKDAELEPFFINAARDPDAFVRRSAIYALGCLARKSNATRTALDNALNDGEAVVRQNAAWAMGRVGLDALPLLKKALGDRDSLVKRDAASALLKMDDADKVHELLKELLPLCRDTNSEVRRAALNVLVQIVDRKDKEAIPPLRVAMEDRDIENRRNAALALSNIGGEETKVALPVLLEAIKNGDDDVRQQSVLAIRNIGPAAASVVGEMVRLVREDKAPKMRAYAALALGGIGAGAESAVPLLVSKVQDKAEDREVRKECAMALAKIGQVPAATAVIPELLTVLGNPEQDGRVRERVMWALRVHGENLRTINLAKETFTQILKETRNEQNRMLRLRLRLHARHDLARKCPAGNAGRAF